MPMRWDPLLAAALARELSRTLGGSRVRALLLDSEARRVLLFLTEHTLVLELHPLRGWVSLLPAREPLPGARPLPVRIRHVEALPDDSALVFALPRVRGRDEGVELIAEMVGSRWNAVVIGHRTRVIRHVLLPREDRRRSLTVGVTYEPPPSTGRRGLDRKMTPAGWDEIVDDVGRVGEEGAGAEPGSDPEERRKRLLRGVAWTSSLNVAPLLGPEGRERWLRMTDPDSWGAFVIETDRGMQPYPVRLEGMARLKGDEGQGTAEPHPTLLDAFRAAREADPEGGPMEALLLPSGVLEGAERRIRRLERRVAGLERQLEKADDPEPIRATGDLILARLSTIPRGAERAKVPDFEGGIREIVLDPSLPPHENAARYYDEAARLERARERLPARIEEARIELHGWSELLSDVQAGRRTPEALAEALGPEEGGVEPFGRRSGAGAKAGGKTGPADRPGRQQRASLPYRRFTSSGGLEIRVGRGSRHNDALTFHHSSPNDVWLHVRQAPGAHVILRWDRPESPPRRDLIEAATLAALNSEARHSGSVPVDWTRRKYVRKPRKAPPGSVSPERVETVFVEPEPGLAERLAPREGPD